MITAEQARLKASAVAAKLAEDLKFPKEMEKIYREIEKAANLGKFALHTEVWREGENPLTSEFLSKIHNELSSKGFKVNMESSGRNVYIFWNRE